MKKLIKMFNELHKGKYEIQNIRGHYFLCFKTNGIQTRLLIEDENWYIILGNPEYKWFNAMRWKYKEIDYDIGNREMTWFDHMQECAGKTADDIIQYCIDNTEETSNE